MATHGMRDLIVPELDPANGAYVTQDRYGPEFRGYDEAIRNHFSWKLERQQTFDEGDDPSWLAFCSGDWQAALRLHDDSRAHTEAVASDDHARNAVFHRVRVVEEPLTPYLRWELYSLRIQHESGMPVRVVHTRDISALEETGPLPEVVVLGGHVVYRVVYTAAGEKNGAVRFNDAGLADRWEAFISALFEAGEDITSYYDRYVAHLPPPKTSRLG